MQLLKTRKIRTEPNPGRITIGSIRLELGVSQTIGKRQEQQDGFLSRVLRENDSMVVAVADGMGGLSNGGTAAKLVLDTMTSELEQKFTCELGPEVLPEILVQAVETAGKQLTEWCREQRITAGTTLAMVVICREELYFCSVGDSRIYLPRRRTGSIKRGSFVGKLFDALCIETRRSFGIERFALQLSRTDTDSRN